MDGLSAAPLLTGGTDPARHDHLYWYRDEKGVTSRANAQDKQRATWLAEALRKDRWKAVRFAPVRDRALPDDQWQVELYDLAVDPGETSDLAARHPARATELVALMRSSWRDQYPRAPFGRPWRCRPSPSPEGPSPPPPCSPTARRVPGPRPPSP